MIDFTECRIIPSRTYNGANGSKIAVQYNDNIYMLKFPPSAENVKTTLSYKNSCLSEHIASSIFNIIGLNAQKTLLGTYRIHNKEKIVCACFDFTSHNKRFFDFCSLKNTILDSDSNGTGTELEDIIDTIEKQGYIQPLELKKHFWRMFVIDAFLGNFDRHNGNWGFLYDEANNLAEIAPIFDCGSCLLPQADENIVKKVLSDKNELNARVFHYPTSAIKYNNKKINYYDFFCSYTNKDFYNALLEIYPKINLDNISSFINKVDGISQLQKEFYNVYLNARYDQILKPAFERVKTL